MHKLYIHDDVNGASKAINKTISELERILNGQDLGHAGALRKKLRKAIIKALEDTGCLWYKKGFNRGHHEAHREFFVSKKVPKRLKLDVERCFLPSTKTKVKLRSRIK